MRATNLLTALQALLAGVQGNLTSEQTNDLSGTHLAAGTPAKVPPARSETSVATSVATASLRSLISAVALGLGAPSALSAVPLAPSTQSAPTSPSTSTALGFQPINPSATPAAAPQPAAPAAPNGVPNDLLGRMLQRAVQVSPIPVSTIVATTASKLPSQSALTAGIVNQPAIGSASSGDTTASPSALTAGLDHLVLSAISRSAQGDANNASSGFAGDTSSDSATAPTLSLKTASSAPPISFASLVAPAITSIHSGISPIVATPPPVDTQAIIEQVVRGLSVRQITDGSEIRMRLVPDHLGEVAVHLTVTGSSVNASVVAQNADVRQTLLANQHHLTRALETSGLKLTGFSVDVFGGNAGNQKNGQDTTS
ncbi:MAG: flagellar hook-length control protein FliK, partial [Vulcanimicrobiaceae bacterium]